MKAWEIYFCNNPISFFFFFYFFFLDAHLDSFLLCFAPSWQ